MSSTVAGFKEPKTRLRKVSELFWQQVEASKETAGEPSLNFEKEVCEPERLLEGAPATKAQNNGGCHCEPQVLNRPRKLRDTD